MTAVVSRPAPPVAAPPDPGARDLRARRDRRAGLAFLSPWLLGMVLLTAGPMLASLALAFTDYNIFDSPHFVGLDNVVEMLGDRRYLNAVGVTASYVLLAVPLKLGLALAVAMLLHRQVRGSGFLRVAFYAPSLVGASVSIAIVWRALFSDGAVVDRLLSGIGISTGGWVGDPDLSLPMLVLLSVWQFGAPMVIFLAGLKEIPPELTEAATIDGAGPVRRFVSITVPLLSPVIFFNLLLEVIHSFQAFTSAFIVSTGTGGPAGSTLLYTLYLYQRGFTDFRMGYASAMAWVLLLVIGVITVALFRLSRFWVHYAGEDS